MLTVVAIAVPVPESSNVSCTSSARFASDT